MVATKHIRIFTLLGLTGVLLVGYQNCSVSLSANTPGASTFFCNPDPTALSEFKIAEKAYLQPVGTLGNGKQGCATCHGPASGNSAVGSYLVYGLVSDGDDVSVQNYCSLELKGASKMLHVQDNSHGGGTYSPTDIPEYYKFIADYL